MQTVSLSEIAKLSSELLSANALKTIGRLVVNDDGNSNYITSAFVTSADFTGCNARAHVFCDSIIRNCKLDKSDFSLSSFHLSGIERARVIESNFRGVIFSNCLLCDLGFLCSDFSGAVFNNCQFKNCYFIHCDFSRSSFNCSDLRESAFIDCNTKCSAILQSCMEGAFFANSYSPDNNVDSLPFRVRDEKSRLSHWLLQPLLTSAGINLYFGTGDSFRESKHSPYYEKIVSDFRIMYPCKYYETLCRTDTRYEIAKGISNYTIDFSYWPIWNRERVKITVDSYLNGEEH